MTGEAEVRVLEAGNERILVALNHEDHDIQPVITLREAYQAMDLVTGESLPPETTLRKHLAAGDVWALRLRRR